MLECFDAQHDAMTLAEIAGRIELTRGSTRRLLLTLEHLGPRKHQKPPHTGFVNS